jgi:ATP-dependent RNA helicase DeaD
MINTNKKTTFKEFNLSENILKSLEKKGFKYPSEIQEKIIPIILDNQKDIIGIADTGTGKTGAFGIPIIENISKENLNKKLPKVIILTPTRELALQVNKEINSFTFDKNIKTLTVYGGTNINSQINELRKGINIIVGTPGRVIDLIKRKELNLSEISYFVLDEADEMLKMGFIEDIEKILKQTPKNKRVYLFSATMPEKIKNLSKRYLKNPETIKIKKASQSKENINQSYFILKKSEKLNTLKYLIKNNYFYGIVFCQTKSEVNEITSQLKKEKLKVDCIHGDIPQNKRERILQNFRKQKIEILIATDVAARGIDVKDLTHVINYNLPREEETYVHRIGRTGRAGKNGIAYSLVTNKEESMIKNIIKNTKNNIKKENLPNKKELLKIKQEQYENKINSIIRKKKFDKQNLELAKKLEKNFNSSEIIASLLNQIETQ